MESGKLVNKVGFEIDSKSWKNLDKFQKRLTDMKKQMKGLSTSVNVRATVNQFKQVSDGIERVRRQTQKKTHGIGMEFGLAGGRDKTYAGWWEDQLKAKERATRDATAKAKRQAAMDDRIANARTRGIGSLGRASVPFKSRQQWSSDFNKLEQSYRKGEISATRFNAKVSELNKNLLHQSKAAKTSGSSMNQLRRQMINLTAAYSAGAVLGNVFNTGKTLQSMEAGMKVFAKDEAGIRENMKFIADESDRLGINLMEAAQNYTKFAIVARNKLSTTDTRALFSGFSEYATVLQVDQHRFGRGMMALQQMMSKGKISSEELRLQLNQ